MDDLRRLNISNNYKAGPRQRGFYCRVDGAMQHLKGITKRIASKIKKVKPAAGSHRRTALKLFKLPPGCSPLINTRANGERIHRHVMHNVVCPHIREGCQCKRVNGKATTPLQNQKVSVKACVNAARSFGEDHGLIPLDAEVIVYNKDLKMATRVDAIYQSADSVKRSDPVTLVSWKSGSGPRDEIELERHRAQVAFEWHSLTETHRVPVSHAYIVYLCAGRQMSSKRVNGFYHAEQVFQDEVPALVARLGKASKKTKTTTTTTKKTAKKRK